ncbi:MAG: stage III sporulation protein AG [Sporolactobacillus sp.]|jgi:stage III sporulation protein AG|nr:stage III sporulation protein AG [Sporolactobacillus sp.]
MQWPKWLRSLVTRDGPPGKNRKALLRLLVLAIIGITLLVGHRALTDPTGDQKKENGSSAVFNSSDAQKLSNINAEIGKSSPTSVGKYETYLNQNLKNILEQIQGVSDVSVMATVDSTGKKIYQNNVKSQDDRTEETDRNGGSRRVNQRSEDSQVVMVDNNGQKEPVVIGEEQPAVRGVLIVARGIEAPAVRAEIMEAVAAVLDIPNYKVKVLLKND